MQTHNWYSKSISEIFKELKSGEEGLSDKEAKTRLQKYGLNKLPEAKVDSYFVIFLRQFQSPLIYILLGASFIFFAMGDIVDALIIFFVLIFNALIGSIQEGKAQNTLLALKKFTKTVATVIRENKEIIISDNELVPGDIIVLQEGDKVPADARIIWATNLKVNESALTGESEPIHKIADILTGNNLQISEQKNMVFRGTNIISGNCRAIVVATGVETVIGKISKEITTIDTEIPLKENFRYLSKLIILVVAILSSFLFYLGVLLGKSPKEMFTTVLSLSVSIIPEGLPVVITLILATGVWRMSKQNVLIKKLQAVEALGQANIIAVDKTGTITKNEMVVQKVYTGGEIFEVEGIGYEPKGKIKIKGNAVNPLHYPELLIAGKIAGFCSNAHIMFSKEENVWRISGDPTDAAMLVFAQKLGLVKDELEKESKLIAEIPFDYKLKYHAKLYNVNGKNFLAVVGAPEVILELSKISEKEKQRIESIFQLFLQDGLRVVALAKIDNMIRKFSVEEIHSLDFVGFLGMKDGLRPEVLEATKKVKSAGMRVVMITGDHKITAKAIAKEAGIYQEGDDIITGQEIDSLPDSELSKRFENASVFARVTPEHKLKIIRAYKNRGDIVAMTGDGVNDALSLIAADLGVAMGKIGTEVAKEASDIILLDDNFGSIVSAVQEGRNIYKTIKKVVLYLFSTSLGEALTITCAILLGYPLPLLPAQIIWLNFVTDPFLGSALAMEPKEKGLLKGKFKRPSKYIVDKIMVQRMILMAITMMMGTIFIFRNYFENDISKAWTMSLTVLAVFQWFNAWNCRHESISIFKMNPFSNKFLLGGTIIIFLLQLLVVYNPLMQKIFRTSPLDISEWILIIFVASFIIFVDEIRKFFHRIIKK